MQDRSEDRWQGRQIDETEYRQKPSARARQHGKLRAEPKSKNNSATPAYREHAGRFSDHFRPDLSPTGTTEPGSVKSCRPADINIKLRKIDAK